MHPACVSEYSLGLDLELNLDNLRLYMLFERSQGKIHLGGSRVQVSYALSTSYVDYNWPTPNPSQFPIQAT
ncbi:hypothetical protein TWF225_010336 [Orbilia oligospora]|uniref:Uncharacterized protein n=1 Tax=Orbilia oligospora TaxID=2813651 RepID=A0A7C8K0T6_ORBOL|nr:hypothetical protein TWF751_011874 [Orbilia oligospora]KAF3172594.1 hypothetical protein TWF225_010336 [Orbilia oligospora]KAF3251637.1 hypothetical protein TWF217_007972 [Orbilia oligospora]KAF3277642.1 hypothetical protein TWF132_001451 [Orbilia oligospora]TGJ65215.1 hypothetical protein EYR41_009205 [Orbilia oligospora]